jgi:hypothetical protein
VQAATFSRNGDIPKFWVIYQQRWCCPAGAVPIRNLILPCAADAVGTRRLTTLTPLVAGAFCRPRKFDMQRLLVTVSTAAAIALFAPPSAVEAQSHTKPVIAPASRTINLTAEQSFIIKGIVLKDLNVPKAQAGAPESIGDSMPSSVLTDQDPGCGFWGFWYTRWA